MQVIEMLRVLARSLAYKLYVIYVVLLFVRFCHEDSIFRPLHEQIVDCVATLTSVCILTL